MDGSMSIVRGRTAAGKGDRFLREVALALKAFDALESQTEGRALLSDEVRALEVQGNWAADWSVVRVSANPPEAFVVQRIRGCYFQGPVLLGSLAGQVCLSNADECPQPCGLYNSTLAWCVVGDGVLVKSCNLVYRCVLGQGAALVGCGVVSCSKGDVGSSGGGGCRFANGMAVEVGPETGGRVLSCYATMTLGEAASAAMDRASPRAIADQRAAVNEYADLASCPASVIGEGARVLACQRVVDTFLGAHALLECSDVEEVTVLSTKDEPSRVTGNCILRRALVQEGVTVDRGCIIADSILMEHSHVANQGQVTHSVLGPDSGVASGECLNSLLGPFIGFHHQSLLIATIWPLGRGNVGYGANVGSNHTSRQADQELWPGEGIFFGLSTVVKFPANYSESPFSVVAAGVVCLPQRVAFPFSLINSQDTGGLDGISPGLNHLRPGWVLAESLFMVLRNEHKYKRRAKARRHRVDWPIFRLSVMKLMAAARSRLIDAASSGPKKIYVGDGDVAGLGKNYMTEAARLAGIDVYKLHLRRYALRGLLDRLGSGLPADIPKGESVPGIVARSAADAGVAGGGVGRMSPPVGNVKEATQLLMMDPGRSSTAESGAAGAGGDDGVWEFQRSLLLEEYAEGEREVETLLGHLVAIEAEVAKGVEASKAKDDKRGAQIIPGYADAHIPAREEATVKLAYSAQAEVERKAHQMLSRM